MAFHQDLIKALYATETSSPMSHDTWIHRAARVCVRPLLETPVVPNHLTAARLVSGIAAAGLIASAQAQLTIVGCVLFLLSTLLDRADGELARLSGRATRVDIVSICGLMRSATPCS
jgi:archaetidylinositol phosphate synthase